MNTTAIPAPQKIDDRDDDLLIWRFTIDNGTVDLEAPDEDTAAKKFAAWRDAPPAADLPTLIARTVAAALASVGVAVDAAAVEAAAVAAAAPPPPLSLPSDPPAPRAVT